MAQTIQIPLYRRKLVFDVTGLTVGGAVRYFRCTNATIAVSGTVTTDRYGAVMHHFPPLGAGHHPELLRRLSVAAWFQPTGGSSHANVRFVTNRSPPVPIPATDQALLTGQRVIPAGHDAVFSRHFMVELSAVGTGDAVASGILYVERQHTIEI